MNTFDMLIIKCITIIYKDKNLSLGEYNVSLRWFTTKFPIIHSQHFSKYYYFVEDPMKLQDVEGHDWKNYYFDRATSTNLIDESLQNVIPN